VATAVRQAAVANLDETGWWQGQDRHWLWTVVTETLTLFRLERSRGKAVVQALLGADWTGIVGSDRYSAYRYLPLDRRQLCWAHLIREFRKIAAYNQHQRPLGTRLLDIATRIFAAWYRFRDGTIDQPCWWRWPLSRPSSNARSKRVSTRPMPSSPDRRSTSVGASRPRETFTALALCRRRGQPQASGRCLIFRMRCGRLHRIGSA
jgi:hypothetical protein